MNIYDRRIIDLAENEIGIIRKQGHATPGTNGPYNFSDTPVRNSAHWCCVFSYLYKCTSELKYLECAQMLSDYLVAQQKKTSVGNIECMDGKKYDHINGLMGQAWAIEGLLSAYSVTKDSIYYQTAVSIFCSQKYDQDVSRWSRIDIDGSCLGDDPTFNHQLWFAAAGTMINSYVRNGRVYDEVSDFLDNIEKNFAIYKNGLIKHYGPFPRNISYKDVIRKTIPKQIGCRISPDRYYYYTYENAYHLFNMYAFAILYESNREHDFFRSNSFTKALEYVERIREMNLIFNVAQYEKTIADDTLLQKKKIARLAYPYNSPAFEYGYIKAVFNGSVDERVLQSLWNIQENLCFSYSNCKYDRNTHDPETLTARIYEMIRYLELINVK